MSDMQNIIPISGRMSEPEYEAERRRLRDTYGDSRRDAGIRWEQALAVLFFRSGWTQDHLAAKEGKSQKWVDFNLRFGRFLANSDISTTGSSLTERAFRQYWEQTDVTLAERARFREVERLMAENPIETKQENTIKTAIRRSYIDGKWHRAHTIAEDIGEPSAEVAKALEVMHRRPSTRYKCERKGGKASYSYRFFPIEKTVGLAELTEKLTPLIRELRSQAKTNMATVAISVFGSVAAQMQQLLDEWGE